MTDPTDAVDTSRLQAALRTAREHLLAQTRPRGYWEGELSSSALSTATALSALALADVPDDHQLMRRAARWLSDTQKPDGGWGDTVGSPSNLSTTLLAAAALTLSSGRTEARRALARAGEHISGKAGNSPGERVEAIKGTYGADRTFAVPILMNCALAELVPWTSVPSLPFELAALPHSWHRALRLHVVSYALPALIAVGLLIHARNPTRNPLLRAGRGRLAGTALSKLAEIQPPHGGFLEATPLTSFVAMSLIALHGPEQPVARKCLEFIRRSVRPDGSWPIDTNLSVWVTTNALSALHHSGGIPEERAERAGDWLLEQQQDQEHPFTHAAPGGWAWTHCEGGVPDADDTSGAVLALTALGRRDTLGDAVGWLLGLQNRDGGWPTFCTGWGRLPFDRSSPDVTAHALMALHAAALDTGARVVLQAIVRGLGHLADQQRPDGAWVPLWFGNQAAPGHQNPVFGTARVLQALGQLAPHADEARRGLGYLLAAQNAEGGWGGAEGVRASVEETARAVIALSPWAREPAVARAFGRGVRYLVERVEQGTWVEPTPIGLYFARLWYTEQVYPVAWTVEALGRALRVNIE